MRLTVNQEIGLGHEEVRAWPLFAGWEPKQHPKSELEVVAADFDKKTRQIYRLQVAQHTPGKKWPAHFILCAPTVDVLTVLSDTAGNKCVVFVEQFREAVGERVISNPAGFIDEGETPEDAALREAEEELGYPGLKYALALLEESVWASPGLTSEETHFFLAKVEMSTTEFARLTKKLQGKATGIAKEGESIIVHVVPVPELPEFARKHLKDGKTRHALRCAGLL